MPPAPPTVVFAMRYPDDIGLVWASMARIYDAVAARLGGGTRCLIAHPKRTDTPVVTPTRLVPVVADLYTDPFERAVTEMLATERVQVAVYFGCDPQAIDLAALRRLGIKTVNYDQDSYAPVHQPLVKRWAKLFVRRVLRRNLFDLYLANADHQREFLIRHAALPPGRVRTVYNGVDPDRFAPGRPPDPAALGLPATDQYVVAVCQARPEKRIDRLIYAATDLFRRRPTAAVTFVHVGDGPALGDWQRLAESQGLAGRFVFAGVRHEVAPYHRLATVFAHTAERESFGFAVAEAMATGKPVVAIRSPGPAELLAGGECGAIVPAGDPARLADALDRYLSNPDLCAAAGAAGRARVLQKYTLGRQADELTAAIRSVLR